MKYYKICTARYTQTFEKYLQDQQATLGKMLKHWEKVESAGVTTYLFEYTRTNKEVLLEQIGRLLTDLIQEKVLVHFSKKYLNSRVDLTDQEKKRIFQTLFLNHYMDQNQGASYLSYSLIYTPLMKDLKKYETIHIEGWITFKTKAYKELLKEIVEESIDEYAVQKDYLDFILLLREDQNMQSPLIKKVHLVADKNGQIHLLNEEKEDKTQSYYLTYVTHMCDQEKLTQEDKMMNILVSLSPEKIVIHGKAFFLEPPFIDTVELVFLGKVEYCEGCELCSLKR